MFLSNREIAELFWSLLFFAYVCHTRRYRFLVFNVLKAFFAKKVIFVFLLTACFIFTICRILSMTNLWDRSMLKDTVIYSSWSIVTLIRVLDERNKNVFRKLIMDQINVTAILIAIINFYTFNIVTELILIFVIIYVIILEKYSSYKEENRSVNKLFNGVLLFIGILLLVVCIFRIIKDPESLFSKNFINSLILPIILTVLLIPYYYCLSLYSVYEQCFVILKVMSIGNNKEYKFRRNAILKKCGLNLNKIQLIKANWRPALCETNEEFIREIDAVSNNKRISYYGE